MEQQPVITDLPDYSAPSQLAQSLSVGFDLRAHPRLVFGENCVNRVGEFARELSTNGKVLLVTDPGIEEAGHVTRVLTILKDAGLDVTLFDNVIQNPTTVEVDHCVETAREADIDTIIGIGGGSAMDTAKGCNFLLTNGGAMEDYWGVGKATQPMLPLIAIPTTGGTGSECQSFALISRVDTHAKMACGDPKAMAKISILDPTLTVTQPPIVTADTGLDAISHAVETAVTTRRNELSMMYSRQAFRLLVANFPRVLETPNDLEARAGMQLGAAFAGTAIENSMLGAAHATANPLTAHYNVIHGQAVCVMLPAVVRFNAEDPEARKTYVQLAIVAGVAGTHDTETEAVDALIARLQELLDLAMIPRTLSPHGVPRSDLPMLASEAATQWTGRFNPRPVGQAEFEALYTEVWS